MADAASDRELIVEGKRYLLKLVRDAQGEPVRVGAWRDGREVHAVGLARFLSTTPPGKTDQAAAVAFAFDQLARDLMGGEP